MPPQSRHKEGSKTPTTRILTLTQAAASSMGLWQPETKGADPSTGQRIPSTGHGSLLWTAATLTGHNTLQNCHGALKQVTVSL